MRVYWLEQCEADVPHGDAWLAESEQQRLLGLRFPKRRSDWRLGRWTAKLAVAEHLSLSLNHTSLRAIDVETLSSGAPEVLVGGQRSGLTISLSHRSGLALCVLTSGDESVGCDLELIESRSDGFISDYFTGEERERINAATSEVHRSAIATLLWSAKESALKALRVGLRADTHSVQVQLRDGTLAQPSEGIITWAPLQVATRDSGRFSGWWRRDARFIRTVVHASDAPAPISLARSRQMVSKDGLAAEAKI